MKSVPPRPVLDPKTLKPETRLVHAGILRSQFAENSEALFLTQGYVYDEAETAEARFSGKEPGFVYSRYATPRSPGREPPGRVEGAEASGDCERHGRRLPRCCAWCAPGPRGAGPALFGLPLRDRGILPRFGVASTWSTAPRQGWEKAIGE